MYDEETKGNKESLLKSKVTADTSQRASHVDSSDKQPDDISALVDKYISRKFAEELDLAESKGGKSHAFTHQAHLLMQDKISL